MSKTSRTICVVVDCDEKAAELLAFVATIGATANELVPVELKLDALTESERRVLQLLAEGLGNEDISKRLYLSPGSVRNYVHSAKEKLGFQTRAEMISHYLRCANSGRTA